jgi:hypothetical protein
MDTRFSMMLPWCMWASQKARGVSVISIKYGSLNVHRVKWKIVLKPRGNIMLGVENYVIIRKEM